MRMNDLSARKDWESLVKSMIYVKNPSKNVVVEISAMSQNRIGIDPGHSQKKA